MADGFVRPLTREQKRIPSELLQQLGAGRPPLQGNRALLEALDQDQCLEFRGVRYRVPPVPCLTGFALQESLDEFQRIAREERETGPDGLARVRDAFLRIINLMVPLAVPMTPAPRVGVGRRLLAWLHLRALPAAPSHPFVDASVQEVAELAHFFSVRSLMSSVRNRSISATRPARSM